MSNKYKNKYRIESNRLRGWDYAGNGKYFITIVTNNRINWFGKIEDSNIILSDFGKIVNHEWLKSFEIRNELFLDEYIIMPNHLHAIVTLKKMIDMNGLGSYDLTTHDSVSHDSVSHVETHGRASLQSIPSPQPPQSPSQQSNRMNANFQRKPKSISSFIAGFKSATTNQIDDYIDLHHSNIIKFNRNNRLWQTNYHDHIILDQNRY